MSRKVLAQKVIANAVIWADSGRPHDPRRLFRHSPEGLGICLTAPLTKEQG